jgi:H+/Cl- antiporter ClcA
MTMEPDDSSKTEPPIRFSPGYLREERRKTRIGGWVGMVASIGTIVDAIAAMRAHRMVDLGPSKGHLLWPPWLVLLVGVALFIGCVWVLRDTRKP